jgi:hypothetical protein
MGFIGQQHDGPPPGGHLLRYQTEQRSDFNEALRMVVGGACNHCARRLKVNAFSSLLLTALVSMCVGCGAAGSMGSAARTPMAASFPMAPSQGTLAPSQTALSAHGHVSQPPSGEMVVAATPSPAYPQFEPGTNPAPVSAVLSSSCLHPGQSQTLTIQGPAGMSLVFDAQYANGRDGRSYGGYGTTKIPPGGTFSGTWAVRPRAPTGRVTVFISMADNRTRSTAFRQPSFLLADQC